ncbi:MAG: alginate lyase family protein [Acidimicrobiaceae bacterium]|nr:alginate lyase family protein [Acidimicrobiaceae bacterium]
MTPTEVIWRVEDRLRQEAWVRRSFGPPPMRPGHLSGGRVPTVDAKAVPDAVRQAVIGAADQLLDGRWKVLGVVRDDLVDPSWALDPISGRAYPDQECAFRIDYRSPGDGRNIKQVWELSRHHHLTVLACAWWLTGHEQYAKRAADHLRSWWRANPVLTGVNWNSGIELGIRLISWVWTRRLLEGWHGAADLFEDDPVARYQIYWHQRWLAAFGSRGSSANNHVIAEAAGQLVASAAFDWFEESERWRTDASALLEHELSRNTFGSGLNREQAFEYHGLVAELGIVAAAEAEAAGAGLCADTWRLLCRAIDTLAAVLDPAGRPPRYGDGDDGRALLVDDPTASRWSSLLATGAALFGAQPWWPPAGVDVQSVWLAALVGGRVDGGDRPKQRTSHFPDAGLTILRTRPGGSDELWCRCDGGPHGFLSIAAHAHADALAVEVRADGVDLLADPGTYCYHSDPAFRSYFRSTLGHNTIELDGVNQSVSGGPFLWVRPAESRVLEACAEGAGPLHWSASHDGYGRLKVPAIHRRSVALDPDNRQLEIIDRLEGAGTHRARMAFHLGPTITANLDGARAVLRWVRRDGKPDEAVLLLPRVLSWRAYRGSTDPLLGWYSAGFGRLEPATTLLGEGELSRSELRTCLCLVSSSPRRAPITGAPKGPRRLVPETDEGQL